MPTMGLLMGLINVSESNQNSSSSSLKGISAGKLGRGVSGGEKGLQSPRLIGLRRHQYVCCHYRIEGYVRVSTSVSSL